ncbi:hypothetical protein K490DRAFT_69402 [Saccharata proteae CBS 121410]|uniref:Uncharacterized protein n=1 Tax=Saccharata proteae CBS 121410 TaxID=1314787 RepID=A0A9P4HPZ0_9PEZI|nr:hypothetical protein K490DRAFT_69402 [Saccharata proteae CBS 121410]
MDMDYRSRISQGLGGRIILLGDGTELSSDSAESDLFDHDEEDKDLESQVDKTQSNEARSQREETPAPHAAQEAGTPSSSAKSQPAASPQSTPTPTPHTTTTSEPESQRSVLDEPKMTAATDTPMKEEEKKA